MPNPTLSQRLAQDAGLTKASSPSLQRATFIALRCEIQQAMQDGWSIKCIWEILRKEEKIDVGYQSFCNYVTRFIHAPQADGSGVKTSPPSAKPEKKSSSAAPTISQKNKTDPVPAFVYNPVPDIKELI